MRIGCVILVIVDVGKKSGELLPHGPSRQAVWTSTDRSISYLSRAKRRTLRLKIVDDLLQLRLNARSGDVIMGLGGDSTGVVCAADRAKVAV